MKDHKLDRIKRNPEDYKFCERCGRINWYENEKCISCRCEDFMEATENDIEDFVKSLKERGIKGGRIV